MSPTDAKQFAPATERNREPILAVLKQVLPENGLVLEIASGTGEHAAFLAPRLDCYWLPTDVSPEALSSIAAWRDELSNPSLLAPVGLDVSSSGWTEQLQIHLTKLSLDAGPLNPGSLSAIVNINMIHISPWSSTLGLLSGAGQLLSPGGILYLYGPYFQTGVPTAPGNSAFDEMLKARNPEWGLRNLETVIGQAEQLGFRHQQTVSMPANNLSVIFQKET